MMNVPVLYFYNFVLPFLHFNCRLFQLFPVYKTEHGLNL